jgi:hypothetical protein
MGAADRAYERLGDAGSIGRYSRPASEFAGDTREGCSGVLFGWDLSAGFFGVTLVEMSVLWSTPIQNGVCAMSFQAYIDNIHTKTGLLPADFKVLAEKKNFAKNGTLTAGTKAGDIIAWLKEDYDLGRGHAMAIVMLLKGGKPKP